MATDQPSRITLDRAKAIADAAVDAGLATWDQHRDGALSVTPPLIAKLDELGVKLLAELTEDQAEVVETFIARPRQKTIQFDQVQMKGEGVEATGEIVNATPVDVAADGESVIFTMPDGTRWGCDQEPLAAVVAA